MENEGKRQRTGSVDSSKKRQEDKGVASSVGYQDEQA